jgi:hypothetical protein
MTRVCKFCGVWTKKSKKHQGRPQDISVHATGKTKTKVKMTDAEDGEQARGFPVAPDEGASRYVVVATMPPEWNRRKTLRGALIYVDNAKHGGYANGSVAPTLCDPPSASGQQTGGTITLLGCLLKDAVVVGVSFSKRLAMCSIQTSGKFTTRVDKRYEPTLFGIDNSQSLVVPHANRTLRCLQVDAVLHDAAAKSSEANAKIITFHLR